MCLVVFHLIRGVNYGKPIDIVYHYHPYYFLLIMAPPWVNNLRNPSVSNPSDPQPVPCRHPLILMHVLDILKSWDEVECFAGGDKPGDAGDAAVHSIRVWSVNIRTWRSTPYLPAGKGLANMPGSSPQTLSNSAYTCTHMWSLCVLSQGSHCHNLLRSRPWTRLSEHFTALRILLVGTLACYKTMVVVLFVCY